MSKVEIECVFCKECFYSENIKYKNSDILDMDKEDLVQYAFDSGARFDCPKCGEAMYLSDCELY